MKIRSLLLAGTVLPFALNVSAFAVERSPKPADLLILAQADPACPEGADCPPASEAAPAVEAPVVEEPTADAPAVEAPAMESEPAAEAPVTEAPAAEEPAAAAQEAPAEPPAAEAAEEPAAGQGSRRQRALERARRQQEELQQQTEQPTAEQPAAEQPPVGATEAPTTEAPAAEAPAAEAPTLEQPATAETPAESAAEEPAPEEPAATTEGAPAEAQPVPGETRQQRRARLRAERQQKQGEGVTPEQPAVEAEPVQSVPAETAPAPAAEGESTVEQQLEAQGDTEQAEQIRQLRQKLREERARVEPEAPAAEGEAGADIPVEAESNRAERRRERREERGGQVVEERGDRIIIDLGGGNLYIERSDSTESDRLLYDARDVAVEELPGGETRTIVYRENGSQIITLRNSYGDIITRTRVTPNGREVVLIDNRIPVVVEGQPQVVFQPVELPPIRVQIPQEEYIVDLGSADEQRIQQTLLAEPVEAVERPYTLEEVTRNERVRDKMSRIDLDTITFAFGSATISTDQMQSLNSLGAAMETVIVENPDEVYLIEGHTDAVGSDNDNLILSDQRAEAVAVALSQNFDIPPENLVTEGYGEQYLKVETEAEERANRRVTVRRITPLLAAEAQQ